MLFIPPTVGVLWENLDETKGRFRGGKLGICMDEKQKNTLMLDFTRLMIKKRLLKEKLTSEEESLIQQIPQQLQMKPREIFQATFPLLLGKNNQTNK